MSRCTPKIYYQNFATFQRLPFAGSAGRPRGSDHVTRSYTSSEEETDSDVRAHSEAKIVAPGSADRYGRTSPNNDKKHLYVVLDDWEKGFSIHKLDLHGYRPDGGDLTLQAPVHRQAIEEDRLQWNFAAMGSKIVAAGKVKSMQDAVTLVYDTDTAGLSIVPRLPSELSGGWCPYLTTATENRIYTMGGPWNGCIHQFEDAPATANDEACWPGTRDHWSWSSIPTQPPFQAEGIVSSAVHPVGGGRTLFVSVHKSYTIDVDNRSNPAPQTFSLDRGTGEWRSHGKWDLPFLGASHYDEELDAWVGLHNSSEPYGADGYLYSCDVVSPNGNPVEPAPKLSADRLFVPPMDDKDPSLVYMGDSNYCLVELVPRDSFTGWLCALVGNECEIHVTTFRLKYGKTGDLTITDRKPKRTYLFPSFYESAYGFCTVPAFWM
ncbi:hypothetical protein VPH35_016940 [Triticum aestivum]